MSVGLKVPRTVLRQDLLAGFILAMVNIPGALANGVLAGVNPVYGVYSMIAGTSVAAVFTSSVLMNVDSTSATSLATLDSLTGINSSEQLGYLIVLGLLVGAFMLAFGLLKLGFLVRFISNSVMTGFLSGLGVLTILGQLGDLTGYYSDSPNKVAQTIDLLRNLDLIDIPTLIAGLITIGVVVGLGRTRLAQVSFLVGLLATTVLVAAVPALQNVAIVGDTTQIPSGLPQLHLPEFSLIPAMLLPALTIAVIALVQASGVSQSVPNPDGAYPDPSGDFRGQGIANIAVGLVGGIPVGGSLSGTTLVRSVGGKSRWTNIFVGIFAAGVMMWFSPFLERLPMPALAGLLVVVGYSMINVARIRTVRQTGLMPLVAMAITFVVTLFVPIQIAVLTGVVLTFIVYVATSAEAVRIERIVALPGGGFGEAVVPASIQPEEIVILQPVGSLFFAGAAEFEEHLPKVGEGRGAVVIIRLRDYDEIGSTFIRLVGRYASQLGASGNRLMLAGVSERVYQQLVDTGLLASLGETAVVMAEARFMGSLEKAVARAREWIASGGDISAC
jgi:SulP family sulfate permease